MDHTFSNQPKYVYRHGAREGELGLVAARSFGGLPGRCCRSIAKADPSRDLVKDEGKGK